MVSAQQASDRTVGCAIANCAPPGVRACRCAGVPWAAGALPAATRVTPHDRTVKFIRVCCSRRTLEGILWEGGGKEKDPPALIRRSGPAHARAGRHSQKHDQHHA